MASEIDQVEITFDDMAKAVAKMGSEMSKAMQNIAKAFKPTVNDLNAMFTQMAKAATSYTMPASSLNHQGMYQRVVCPTCKSNYKDSLRSMIIHLNDYHRYTREEIADWLDTLDNQPVFYPDLRTDDEKIAEAEAKKKRHAVLQAGYVKYKESDPLPIPQLATTYYQLATTYYQPTTPILHPTDAKKIEDSILSEFFWPSAYIYQESKPVTAKGIDGNTDITLPNSHPKKPGSFDIDHGFGDLNVTLPTGTAYLVASENPGIWVPISYSGNGDGYNFSWGAGPTV